MTAKCSEMHETPSQVCKDCAPAINAAGGSPCSDDHCKAASFQGYKHAICTCTPPYNKGIYVYPDGSCRHSVGSAIFVFDGGPPNHEPCFCCCGCFAYGTLIHYTIEDSKAIEDYAVGDMVLVADSPDLSSWSQKKVVFSNGAGASAANLLVMVIFETEDGTDYLLCTQNQPFLMSSGRLKTANKLVPGVDELLRHDGSPVMVHALRAGHYDKGVHHISTSLQPATSLDGHLFLAKGIVVGDYSVQIAYETDSSTFPVVEDLHLMPSFDSPEYLQTYDHLVGDEHGIMTAEAAEYMSAGDGTNEQDSPELANLMTEVGFNPLAKTKAVNIAGRRSFFTDDQALELAHNTKEVKRYAPGTVPPTTLGYLFTIYKAFYPDTIFYHDIHALEPNAHSFHMAGTDFVVVNDGLVQLESMTIDSLALVIAHELAHLSGDAPADADGYSCTGQADYQIMPIMAGAFFNVHGLQMMSRGLAIIKTLFDAIKVHRGGGTADTCDDISLDCRLKAMQAPQMGLPLPHCAGGPPDPALKVLGAKMIAKSRSPTVGITFNLAVDPDSGSALGNYIIDSAKHLHPNMHGASVDTHNPEQVNITFESLPPGEYSIYVTNVLSANHQPLIPQDSGTTLTVKGHG